MKFCPHCGTHLIATPAALTPDRRTLPRFVALFEASAAHFGVRVPAILSPSRDRSVARARKVIAYLLRRDHRLSYPEIGVLLDRDHTTAIHSVRSVENDPAMLTAAAIVRAESAHREAA